jgi:hypothetical protein
LTVGVEKFINIDEKEVCFNASIAKKVKPKEKPEVP